MTAYRKDGKAVADFERENFLRKESGGELWEYFMPMCYKIVGPEGRKVRKKVPLLPGYLFVRAAKEELCEYIATHTYLAFYHPVIRGYGGCIAVPERQMEDFIRVAREYEEDVRYFRPGEADLQEGDRVRVVGGKLDGVEGVLLSVRGKAGGRVVVSIPGLVAVSTWELSPDYLEILSFAPAGRRIYSTFDAFFALCRKALLDLLRSGGADEESRVALRGYVGRLRHLKTGTANQSCMWALLMLMAYAALGCGEEARKALARLRECLPSVRSESQQAYFRVYLYAATGGEADLLEARRLTARPADGKDGGKKRQDLADDLALFEGLYKKGDGR